MDKRVEEFSKQLGQLWEQTTDKLDEFKDAVVRSVHAGRLKLDVALLKREQERVFYGIGEQVFRQSRSLNLPPSVRRLVEKAGKLAAQIAVEEKESRLKGALHPAARRIATRGRPRAGKRKRPARRG